MTLYRSIFPLTLAAFTAIPAAAEGPDADLEAMAARLRTADATTQAAESRPPDSAQVSASTSGETASTPARSDLVDFQTLADRTHAWGADRPVSTARTVTRHLVTDAQRFNDLFPIQQTANEARVRTPPDIAEAQPCGTDKKVKATR